VAKGRPASIYILIFIFFTFIFIFFTSHPTTIPPACESAVATASQKREPSL
jgi:hypothetical protein